MLADMRTDEERIEAFLEAGPWAVAGASTDRAKYGNKVLRCYLQQELEPVFPLNPREPEVEGRRAFSSLSACPEPVRSLSVITPPAITEALVEEAAEAGVKHVWMQPGAESSQAVDACRDHGLSVIHGGPCLLVVLRYRE